MTPGSRASNNSGTPKGAMGMRSRKRGKGFAIVMTTLMLTVLIPMAGLAVDAGVMYVIHGRLVASLDSAALAAARSVVLGNDIPTAQANATASARRFFKANFPSGYMAATYNDTDVTTSFALQTDGGGNFNGVLLIGASANVTAPTYFMRLFKKNSIVVSASGSVTRRNLVLMLILDKSGSLGARATPVGTIPATITGASNSCDAMVYGAATFIQQFSPYDTAGMVDFDVSAYLGYAPSSNFKAAGASGMTTKIAALNCNGNTNTTAALELAYDRIKAVDQKLAMNVIVLFTDGVPNGVNAVFPIRMLVDSRIGTASTTPAPANVPAGNYNNCTTKNNVVCQNMPVKCAAGGTVTGVIAQGASFSTTSGARSGMYKAYTSDPNPTFPAGCVTSGTTMTSQSLAYIPNTDRFGNSTHGPMDGQLMAVNNQCAPAGTPVPPGNGLCKDLGGLWSSYPAVSVGSNFYTAGPYAGFFRTDHTNTIGVVGMNSAINSANKIKSDPTYKPMIHTIYVLGNGSDPVNKTFLPIISNVEKIPPIVYEPVGTLPYTNPYFNSNHQIGLYLQGTSPTQLAGLFAQIASSLLRINE